MDQLNKKSLSVSSSVRIVRPTVNQPKILGKNENRSQPQNYVNSFRPIYYFSRVAGLMPFSIVWNPKEEYYMTQVRIIDGFWFTLIACVNLLVIYFVHQKNHSALTQYLPYLFTLVGTTNRIISQIFGAALIVMDMFNRSKMIDILNMFNLIDKEVGNTLVFIESFSTYFVPFL